MQMTQMNFKVSTPIEYSNIANGVLSKTLGLHTSHNSKTLGELSFHVSFIMRMFLTCPIHGKSAMQTTFM